MFRRKEESGWQLLERRQQEKASELSINKQIQNFGTPRARENMDERVSSRGMAVETGLGLCSSSDGIERSLFDAWDP